MKTVILGLLLFVVGVRLILVLRARKDSNEALMKLSLKLNIVVFILAVLLVYVSVLF